MSGSSSNRRRRHCRSRTWSCASRQRILLPKNITSFESVRGGTQFSFIWPESLQNDAGDWAEPELHKNMNVGYCSNHLHSCAYEICRGVHFLATFQNAALYLHRENSVGTPHQVKSTTYAALLHCRRITRRGSGRLPLGPARGAQSGPGLPRS